MQYSMHILLILAIGAAAAPLNDPQTNYLPPDSNYLPPADTSYLPPESAESTTETTVLHKVIADEPLSQHQNHETLPQAEEITEHAPAELTQDSAVLNDDGYAYRTVHRQRLRYRTRRDVAHLNLAYLPPSQEYLPPSHEYLPPSQEYLPPTQEYLPPSPEYLPPSQDYLPPHEDNVDATEQPEAVTSPKINLDYLPPVTEQASLSLPVEQESLNVQVEEEDQPSLNLPAEESEQELPNVSDDEVKVIDTLQHVVQSDIEVSTTEPPQDTAILAADGYHYKQPAVAADLSSIVTAPPVTREYLPPAVEAVNQMNSESAGKNTDSADAGYHYSNFKRFRY